MTNQEKKEKLQEYQEANSDISQKLEDWSKQKSLCCKVTATLSDMPKGGESVKEDAYIKLVQLWDEIQDYISASIDKRYEIEKIISTLDEPDLQRLLRYRYINNEKFEAIAQKMGYGYEWTCRLHGQALNKLVMESHT